MTHQLPFSLQSPTPYQESNTLSDTTAYPYLNMQPTHESDSIDLDKIKGTFQHNLATPSKPISTTPYQSPYPSYIIGSAKDNENKYCFI